MGFLMGRDTNTKPILTLVETPKPATGTQPPAPRGLLTRAGAPYPKELSVSTVWQCSTKLCRRISTFAVPARASEFELKRRIHEAQRCLADMATHRCPECHAPR